VRTLYSACLSRLGLSQTEAAVLHKVRTDMIKSWSTGCSCVPDEAWEDLRDYEAKIIDSSEQVREMWREQGEPLEVDAAAGDLQSLMALADFVLSAPVRVA